MSFARHMAHALAHHAASGLPWERAAWAEPMRQEVDSIEDDLAALRWAAGCVVATYSERINAMGTASLPPLLGLVALFAFVFGGYMMVGGHIGVIIESLPHYTIVIGLGALAASSILTTVGVRVFSSRSNFRLKAGVFRKATTAIWPARCSPD